MKLDELKNQYGGYWNKKNLLDYNFLVNPYFPTSRMMREIRRMSRTLITNYPACIDYICRLTADIFSVNESHIVVGNGASELIKHLCEKLEGKTGVVVPTFNEYIRLIENRLELESKNYNAGDIVKFFSGKIDNFVIVNPQLHTGHYLDDNEIDILIEWCRKENINLIMDESFIDFADINQADDLKKIYKYENMFIIKSLCKSYGMPGMRLGVLASQNKAVEEIKRDLPIWNISSFAEYFLEIFPKHKEDFIKALKKIEKERERFEKRLKTISGFSIIKSFANYISIEVNSIDTKTLCEKLFERNILIRDLSSRGFHNCIRVAVRGKRDNNKLIKTIKRIIDEQ